MPSELFDPGREGILDRSIDMTGDVRVALIADTYAFRRGHRFLKDLVAHVVGRSEPLSGKTYRAGVFDASDLRITAGRSVRVFALVLFQQTGLDATARLVAHIDRADGLPFTPNAGQAVEISWSDGPERIFKL